MTPQDPAPNLPGYPNLWYHLVRPSKGVHRILIGDAQASGLAEQCAHFYGSLPEGWTIAVQHHGSQNIAPSGSWHESFLILPSNGGARALLSCETTAAFRMGIPLLPGGRLRTRIMRASLNLPGAAKLLSLQGRKRITMITKPENPDDQSALQEMETPIAVCEGVPGPLRKIVVGTQDFNGDRFFKVAGTTLAIKSIQHETHALAALKGSGLAPNLLARDSNNPPQWFAQEGLTGSRAKAGLNPAVLTWLTSLAARKQDRRSVESVLPKVLSPHASDSQQKVYQELSDALKLHLAGATLPCTPSHGDFTPWNTRVQDNHLMAFDWEFYGDSTPALFDLLHYELQTGILMQKIPAESALDRVLHLIRSQGSPLCRVAGVRDSEIELLASAYLLTIADRDATLHSIERPSFEQVEWLESARLLWARQLTEKLRASSRLLSKAS